MIDRVVPAAHGAVEQALEAVRLALCLSERILDLVLAAAAHARPASLFRVKGDRAALDFEREDSAVGMGRHEVGLTLLRTLSPLRQKPRHLVQRDEPIVEVVADPLEQAALGIALAVDRPLRDHRCHF